MEKLSTINESKTNDFDFDELYEYNFPQIKNYILQNSGSIADAEDIFQEARLILINKLNKEDFKLTASIHTYTFAICKNLWLKSLRNKITYKKPEQFEERLQEEPNQNLEEDLSYAQKIKFFLKKVSSHCNRLIEDFFYNEKKNR